MAFPTTPLLDDFNRADSSPIDGDWLPCGAAQLAILNQQCTPVDTYVGAGYYSAATYARNCEVYATIDLVPVDPNTDQNTLILMMLLDDPSLFDANLATFYALMIDNKAAIYRNYSIIRFSNEFANTLLLGTLDINDGDSFGLELIGNTLTAYRKPAAGAWTVLGSVVDSVPLAQTSGYLALQLYRNNGVGVAPFDTMEVDDFGGGIIPPADPTALTATAISDTRIDLAWTDNSTNETGFKIERSLTGIGAWSQVDTTAAGVATYSNTGLTESTLYYYRVRAYVTGADSGYSNTASATTKRGPTQTPEAPTLLTATPAAVTSINLAWVDNSLYETGFEVERSLTGTGAWVLISTTAANATTYADTNCVQGTLYYYRVRAITATLASAYSNIASARIGEFMITEIANSLIAYMAADTDLLPVLLFIRGGTPFTVPQDHTPFCEVLIGEETPVDDLTGSVSTRTYRGLITFTALVQQDSGADWLTTIDTAGRIAYITSYDLIKRLVMIAQTELQRYPSLGYLTTTVVLSDQTIVEAVTAFRFEGSIIYGLDDRTDNYENFGSLPFVVETERTIT